MTYPITVLQAALTALKRVGIFDVRTAQLQAAIDLLEQAS